MRYMAMRYKNEALAMFLRQSLKQLGFTILLISTLTACNPRVELAASEKPITINMNVKIDHEVRIKVERDLEGVISKDSDLF